MALDTITTITEKIMADPSYILSPLDALKLLLLSSDHDAFLIGQAGRVRNHFLGNTIFTCSIINAKSGQCTEDCAFCAQSSHHEADIKTYPLLDRKTLVDTARQREKEGASRYSMVTSGFMLRQAEIDTLCHAAEQIRKETNLILCASVGVVTIPYLRQMKSSGITRYHHNLETARSYFKKVCTTHDYEADIEAILLAKQEGMDVCSGGIMGLGENWEQRVELAVTLRDLDVDAIPLNFLNPIPGTPLEKRSPLKAIEALKTIAIMRFLNPKRHITICGGREITLADLQPRLFEAGADGVMIGNYLTTRGRAVADDMAMIRELALRIERP